MEIGRELSREVFAVSINKARTVLGTDTHWKSWLNCAIKWAIFSILTQGREEAWLLWLPYILDHLVGFIDKIRHIGTILSFLLVSLWSRGWRSDPTSVLPISMSLGPITRATVVIFSKLGFGVSFTVCHLLIALFSVTFGEEMPIFVPLTLRRGVGRYRHV